MWSQVFPLLVLMLCSSAWSQESMTKEQIEAYKWATELFKKNIPSPSSQTIDNRFHNDLTPVKPNTSVAKSCVTEDKVKGVCTKTSLCNKEAPKIDPENDFTLRDRDLCHILEICCPMSQVLQLPKKPEPTQDKGCGYSNPGASVFRQKTSKNGYADYGEFPWMVALLKAGSGGWSEETYLGGGTIIHLSVVMTVAHKVDSLEPSDLKCRAGEWDTQTDKEAFDYQERDVAKIILHEDFNRVPAHNNIALLTLKQPFVKEPHVGVACLSLALPPPGTVCYSMGWGEDFTKSDKYSNLLKKITLPLVGRDTCEMRYRNTRLGSGYKLHRTLTCAGGEAGVDTCLGDGGSSLVCPVGKPAEQRYAVVGMVAYGLECGTKNVPGVYVKVPEFFDWVGGRLVREGFNRSSFELETESLFKLRS